MRAGFPKFKTKKNAKQSFRIPQRVVLKDGKVYVPKLGWVKVRQSQDIEGEPRKPGGRPCAFSKGKSGDDSRRDPFRASRSTRTRKEPASKRDKDVPERLSKRKKPRF
jgi:hypothetical protein